MALIIANWKMYLTLQEADDFCINLVNLTYPNQLLIAAPVPYLAYLAHRYMSLKFAAQNISSFGINGPYTGEYSSNMIKSCNINHTIIGHSERRKLFNETKEIINKKILNAINSNITPIICIGDKIKPQDGSSNHLEITSQLSKLIPILKSYHNVDSVEFAYEEGRTQRMSITLGSHDKVPEFKSVDYKQFIIAYEPYWAIGTGLTPTISELTEIFAFIKSLFNKSNLVNNVKLVYGGSVNLENIAQILSIQNIDGALIGSYSINKENLIEIIQRRY